MSSARHQHEDVFLPGGPLQLNLNLPQGFESRLGNGKHHFLG